MRASNGTRTGPGGHPLAGLLIHHMGPTLRVRSNFLSIWTDCPGTCDDKFCLLHESHVWECACPELDWWIELDVSPYEVGVEEARRVLVVIGD